MGDLLNQLLEQERRARKPDLLQQLIAEERAREAARMGMMPPDPRIAGAFERRSGGGQPPAPAVSESTRAMLVAEAQRRQEAARAQIQGGTAPARGSGEPIVVTGPDGQEFEFPAGTSEEVMRRALARHYQGQAGGVSPAQQDILNQVLAGEPAPTISLEVQRARDEALRRVQAELDQGSNAGVTRAMLEAEAERRGLTGPSGGYDDLLARLDGLTGPPTSGDAPPADGAQDTHSEAQRAARYQAVLRARRAARAAGDTAGAERLARMAQELRPTDLRARLDALTAPEIPGYSGPANVDANSFGGPDPAMGDRMAALLTPEGQAARREGLPPPPPPRENEWLGGVLPSPRQAGRNFRENLFGDDDPTTMNRGEALAAALNKAGEAMTFGLAGDEAAGWVDEHVLGRGPAEERTAFYRDQEEQLWDQRPGLALTAEIGGALLGPGKGVGAFINRGVGTGARVGRGLLAGAGTGAVYGAAEAERDLVPMEPGAVGGIQDRVVGGLLGAGLGGAAGAAVTGIGQGFGRLARALRGRPGGQEAAASVEGLRTASQALYDEAAASGVMLPQSRLAQLATDVTDAVKREGYHVRLHPRLRAVLSEIRDVAAGDQSLGRLEQARRVAGNAAKSIEPDERRLASIVIDHIDDMVEELGESSAPLREARSLWARMSRLERLEGLMEDAANSDSFETTLASRLRTFLRNPRNLRGFNETERRTMQQIARGSTGVKALRGLADLLSLNSPAGLAASAGAFFTSAPLVAVPPLAGAGARAIANGMVRAQGNALRNMVGQTEAQRAALDGLLRQPNALAPLAQGATPQGLLGYATRPEPLRLTVDGSPPRY